MAGSDGRDKNLDSSVSSSITSTAAGSTTTSGDSFRISTRSSFVDSFKGCGLSGIRIDKEDLRRRVVIPEYLRMAMVEAMRSKDASLVPPAPPGGGQVEAPETPMIIFVNSRSGGRHGPILKGRLQELMGQEQVFDLSAVKPSDFVQYGLACLENLASHGDNCAKETREKMRIMVAGGDGTVGWVLGSIGELHKAKREPVPPIGIIPLGTGNDLSRSFGWGGSFPFAWKSAVKRSLYKAIAGPIYRLDSWEVVVSMPSGEDVELPHSLRYMEDCPFGEDGDIEGNLPEKVSCFGGVFYNYYSIGMDAQVAYGFHHLRDEKPYLAQGPIANKLIYSGYSCTQGWFFTPCLSDPSLRGLNNIVRLHIKKVNCSEWEQIRVPSSVRAVVALNLHNYGSGRNPWGNLKPNYLEKRGFVEAHADDGLLEIFGLKQGWHASFVMVELISAKHIAQAASIRLEIRGGQWKHAYMQMDGEPWKQPIHKEFSTFLEIKRVAHHSLMIGGE
ncbi:diacylglycerol kinase 4-like [Magnolia sinica]|uniref:diacylglycerol kinase 4-like n=1 Tax=Magnolia sinica TaxID=86752 RepID=UPI00265A7CB2|nr:diacylglycerol kinase 4-like [Magnolia sinica]